MMIKLRWSLTAILFLLISVNPVFAASNDSSEIEKAKSTLKVLKTKLKEFRRSMKNSKVRAALSSSESSLRGLDDSDSDGLPDLYEHALDSNSCDSDSDDDGINDHDEGSAGSKPNNPDSGEIEIKALITDITSTTVTVDGHIFTVYSGTDFRDGSSLASYSIGDLVEVKGELLNGVLTLIKIHKDDN